MNENVNVCITPKGDKPVLHFSQFDNERIFTVTVFADDGESAAVLTGLDIEFRIRKTDSHVVTIAPESVTDNVITFKTTEQMCACCGQNIASVVLMKDDMIISTLDILVDIQRDILSGGLTSESDIRNLTTQIETIIPEVLADDYYTKDQVDEIIAEHTIDPDDYYDKSDVDTLLSAKADASDVYTKGETDTLLSAKADATSTYNMTQVNNLLGLRLPIPQEQEVQNLPASVVTIANAGEDAPLSELTVAVTAVQSGSGTPSPSNPRPISGFSGANIVVADENMVVKSTTNISFGQEVYGGVLDVTNGKLTITHTIVTLNDKEWYKSGSKFYTNGLGSAISGSTYTYDFSCSISTPTNKDWNSLANGECCLRNGLYAANTWSLAVCSTEYATADDFKNALTANCNCTIPLVTPTEITFTPAEVDTLLHDNNIYSDTGDVLTMKYIIAGSEDVFKYIRMIKG